MCHKYFIYSPATHVATSDGSATTANCHPTQDTTTTTTITANTTVTATTATTGATVQPSISLEGKL